MYSTQGEGPAINIDPLFPLHPDPRLITEVINFCITLPRGNQTKTNNYVAKKLAFPISRTRIAFALYIASVDLNLYTNQDRLNCYNTWYISSTSEDDLDLSRTVCTVYCMARISLLKKIT